MDIFLDKWVPILLAGFISFFTAWILKGIERSKAFKDKRTEIADKTISNFSVYIENWKKLIAISHLAKQRDLSDNEKSRIDRYILNRDEAKHNLSSCLSTLTLYFDEDVLNVARDFRSWDSKQSTKRLDELPEIQEWENWLYNLSNVLKKHI